MGQTQIFRGNPENKSVYLSTNFVGGVNVTYSDDTVEDTEFRQLLNYNIDNRGSLDKRKGFSRNNALTQLITHGLDELNYFPVFANDDAEATCSAILVFKILTNSENLWSVLSDMESLQEYQEFYGHENNVLKFLIISKAKDGTYHYNINKYNIGSEVITDHKEGTLPITSKIKDNLMSKNVVTQFNKVFITANEQGLIIFDNETDEFTFCGDFDGVTNNAYKPNAIEIRKVGFNVLGTNPLTWIGSSSITTESIRGVYLTTTNNIPVQVIPDGEPFRINILFTGDKNTFEIKLKENENEISADINKNTDLSTGNLAVYDVMLKTKPSKELEISIKHDGQDITLEPYIDYYSMGVIDPNAKPVESLNVGEFELMEMSQRLVLYKGDTIWFSEIMRYDYIPNYNYVILPIEPTDYITKIVFFRNNYIVFTAKRIYKLMGTFGLEDFEVRLVNSEIGCDQPNSIRVANDELIFVSPSGLRNLKLDAFRENLENVKSLDDKVRPLIPTKGNSYAVILRDEYMLFYNNPNHKQTVEIAYRDYVNPDVCRYYFGMKAFVFDKFQVDKGAYPRFIIPEGGNIYSIQKVNGEIVVHKYGQDYDDFGEPYEILLETAGVNFGYAMHQKKIKNIMLKVGGGEIPQYLYAEVFSDGAKIHSTVVGRMSVDENGTIYYEEVDEPNVMIAGTTAYFEQFYLDISKFGYNPNILVKLKMPLKAKNASILLRTTNSERLNVQALGYIYKLGKVKE